MPFHATRVVENFRSIGFAIGATLFVQCVLLAASAATDGALAQYNEAAREIERGATQIWNKEKVRLDSELRGIRELIDVWDRKFQTFAANNKSAKGFGRFGDPKALSKDLVLRPSKVASDFEAEIETALNVKSEQLEEIKQRRGINPNALDLYRDEAPGVVAVNALSTALYNAREDLRLCKLIELYFELRLTVASSISTEAYAKEFKTAKKSLEDLWKTWRNASVSSREMMNFFLSY
jgi:hypothetical protein